MRLIHIFPCNYFIGHFLQCQINPNCPILGVGNYERLSEEIPHLASPMISNGDVRNSFFLREFTLKTRGTNNQISIIHRVKPIKSASRCIVFFSVTKGNCHVGLFSGTLFGSKVTRYSLTSVSAFHIPNVISKEPNTANTMTNNFNCQKSICRIQPFCF